MKAGPLCSRSAKVHLSVMERDEGTKVTGILVVEPDKKRPSDNEELEADEQDQPRVLHGLTPSFSGLMEAMRLFFAGKACLVTAAWGTATATGGSHELSLVSALYQYSRPDAASIAFVQPAGELDMRRDL
eukprot:CAMPEP_0173377510 /NCGR_PEP_ID=MMETSP1356-20130122/757_1 /TAXON_ID=77927 ORGANISM="Hemiselmis virescens, Strain PCC157" /NCGR_SAMPLE_ID=MMETSP1356 /ASSEMBLY_ACC=CAM_ASM_000847 /LENGTH=129 /DNA_ID=CAMNT_0014330285 /DNA_START=309 /DNA_END=699 /DNA_ORIENTATION=-